MQRWWNLSKLVTNTLVNFSNFFNSLILPSSFLIRKKYLQKTLFGRNGQFPSGCGIMMGGGLLETWVKMSRFNFLSHKYIFSHNRFLVTSGCLLSRTVSTFYRPDQTKGETTSKWVFTIFRYKNECYKQLQQKT